ncbi:MAG: fimbrial biogenesis outer membrane usher protein [Sphingomonas sp.]|uniref:fimbria/pilus outer membrane usher protein n=1 Tax=Sphingomonas sp. TaxID=28214 RepID=UPI001B1B92D8|nr:fimbria/pilus outer membrane usher protein [Sphingomonas sp.]MBO9623159.1 fimbrial biogenesis outer membrane usher protein [Sphingomonas sp.]
MNGIRSPLWWEFDLLPDGSLAISAERLRLLGFALRGIPPDAQQVRLSDLPGVTYRYVEAQQMVEIDAGDQSLVPVVLDASAAPRPLDLDRVTRNTGAVLNYGIYADGSEDGVRASAQYDFRLLTGLGVASTSGYLAYDDYLTRRLDHIRLDTNWRSTDVRRAITLTIGDTVGEGGQLNTAYRLGGIQLRRDYDMRPDLVTTALPTLNGSAAVPSAIDLYINGLRYYTGEVRRGPFQFRSLPSLRGGATATIVLTDANGRVTRFDKPLFFVPGLLPQGKLDFSVEAGFPRLNYGSESFDYFDGPAASASVRYGITDALTLQGHAEGMGDLVNGSLGGTLRLGTLGAVTAGFGASRFRGKTGTRYLLEAQTRLLGVDLYGSIERSDSDFQTIVTATELKVRDKRVDSLPEPLPGDPMNPFLVAFSRRTERAGASFSLLGTGFNLAYTRVRIADRDMRIANVGVQRTLGRNVSLWGNAYKRFGDSRDYAVVVGLSMQLGRRSWASSNVSYSPDSTRISSQYTHNTGSGEGSWSWSLASSEVVSGSGSGYAAADVVYRAHHATLGAGLEYSRGSLRVNGYAEGAIVAMGGVFLTPSIDRSFAVVRGAGPNTPLFVDTRAVAHADSRGRALLPSLRSLATNTIAIDPSNLPVDLQAPRTEIEVVPDDRAGVIVDFRVAPEAAAVVILVDDAGTPLPVGSTVVLEGGGEPAVVGFDGRTFLTGLKPQNRALVHRAEGADCSVSFDFKPVAGQQVVIGPLPCR